MNCEEIIINLEKLEQSFVKLVSDNIRKALTKEEAENFIKQYKVLINLNL